MAMAVLFSLKSIVALVFFTFLFSLLISWFISKYELQPKFLMLMALMLPVSVEYNITESVMVNLPTEPMLGIAILSICWDIINKKNYVEHLFTRETLWILPLIGSFIIASFFSEIHTVSVKYSIINCGYILVFFIWLKHFFKVYKGLFVKLMLLYSLSLIVVLVYATINFIDFDMNPITIKGVFKPFYRDHTILGATSGILSMFWLSFSIKMGKSSLKLLSFLLGILFFLTVIFSHSRAAFLSLLFSGMVGCVLVFKIQPRYLILGVLILSISVVAFWKSIYSVLILNTKLSHTETYAFVDQIQSSANITSDISNIERLNRWLSGIAMFVEKPITGFGPGTFQFEYIPFQKEHLKNRLSVTDPWHIPGNSGGTAHSEYILVLSEMGLLGFVSLLILMGRWGWIIFFKNSSPVHRPIIIIAGISLSSYFFHAFFNNFLNTDKFAFLFWGIAAWMVGNFETKKPDAVS